MLSFKALAIICLLAASGPISFSRADESQENESSINTTEPSQGQGQNQFETPNPITHHKWLSNAEKAETEQEELNSFDTNQATTERYRRYTRRPVPIDFAGPIRGPYRGPFPRPTPRPINVPVDYPISSRPLGRPIAVRQLLQEDEEFETHVARTPEEVIRRQQEQLARQIAVVEQRNREYAERQAQLKQQANPNENEEFESQITRTPEEVNRIYQEQLARQIEVEKQRQREREQQAARLTLLQAKQQEAEEFETQVTRTPEEVDRIQQEQLARQIAVVQQREREQQAARQQTHA